MRWMCSSDCHLIEPADLWVERVPASMRDVAPKYELADGFLSMCSEGRVLLKVPVTMQALPDGSLPPQDVDERQKLLAEDGIWAETLIGNLAGVGVMGIHDPELAMACARVYNDWLTDTFGPYRDREVPLALIPLGDLDAARGEIERAAGLGFRGITMPIRPPEPYFLEQYDGLWDAAAEAGVPISFHSDTGRPTGPSPLSRPANATPRLQEGTKTVGAMRLGNQAFDVAAAIVGAGVLERHPGLHVVFVECGAGWMASAIPAMDFAWAPPPGVDRSKDVMTVDAEGREVTISVSQLLGGGWPHPLRPSEYMRRQVHATFQDEPAAVTLRHAIGIDQLMWGSDFPHPEGTWPRSRAIVDELFAGVDEGERDKILGGTMAKLYGLEVPASV
jgi:predicted TIM-barrel fold metal-dependent hydrolase